MKNIAPPTKKVDVNTPKVENNKIGHLCILSCSKLVCKAPANSKKLNISSSKTDLKSILEIIDFSKSKSLATASFKSGLYKFFP